MNKAWTQVKTGRLYNIDYIPNPVEGYIDWPVSKEKMDNAEDAEFEIIKSKLKYHDATKETRAKKARNQ